MIFGTLFATQFSSCRADENDPKLPEIWERASNCYCRFKNLSFLPVKRPAVRAGFDASTHEGTRRRWSVDPAWSRVRISEEDAGSEHRAIPPHLRGNRNAERPGMLDAPRD